VKRATAVCTNIDNLNRKKKRTATLLRNGYPPKLIKFSAASTDRIPLIREPQKVPLVFYIQEILESFHRMRNRFRIQAAFRSWTML
jgi:hypothetical protein